MHQGRALAIKDSYLNMLVVMIMLLLVAPFVATGVVSVLVAPDTDLRRVLFLFMQQFLWLAIAWWHLSHNLQLSLYDLGSPSVAWQRWPRLLGVSGLLVLVNAVGSWVARNVAALFLGPGRALALYYQEQASVMGLFLSQSPLVLLLLLLTTSVLVPVAEELIFRGYFHGMLKEKVGRHAIWVSSLLFTLTHFYIINALPVFLMALILTWLYEKNGNLWDSIIAHGILNTVVAGMLILRG